MSTILANAQIFTKLIAVLLTAALGYANQRWGFPIEVCSQAQVDANACNGITPANLLAIAGVFFGAVVALAPKNKLTLAQTAETIVAAKGDPVVTAKVAEVVAEQKAEVAAEKVAVKAEAAAEKAKK